MQVPDSRESSWSSLTADAVRRYFRRSLGAAAWEYRVERGRPGTALRALRAQQWLSLQRVTALQSQALQRLVDHAYRNVPYYARVMSEHNVRPEQIRSARDLVRLPVLTKDIIREHFDELWARRGVEHPQTIVTNHTGGSTGSPLTFLQDEAYDRWAAMNLIRGYEMCGYRLGDPIAFLWGSDYDARSHLTLRGRLRDTLRNTLFLDAFDCNEQQLVTYARKLAAFRPRLLVGYVSSLVLLARVIEAHALRGVEPFAIQSSAEVLAPAQRSILERTFSCRVFDRYGCREVGNIAHECAAHAGLHLLADVNAVEIVLDDRVAAPGEEGNIAVTNLHNMAMPLIRYVNGDVGVASDEACPCGRGLPLLRKVLGRSADIIVAPSGKLLHGEFFTHLFYKLPSVREFQVLQRTLTVLEISLVRGPGFDESSVVAFLRDVIGQYGDPAFDVRFKVVERIKPSSSGKFRFTISEVSLALAGHGGH